MENEFVIIQVSQEPCNIISSFPRITSLANFSSSVSLAMLASNSLTTLTPLFFSDSATARHSVMLANSSSVCFNLLSRSETYIKAKDQLNNNSPTEMTVKVDIFQLIK